jgi:hypothetical protein
LNEKPKTLIPLQIKNLVRKLLPGLTSRYRRLIYRAAHFPRLTYSFAGEDILISFLLADNRKKVRWVDVGCAHPIFDNNTYSFYRKGGLGVNVDARKSLGLAHRIFRPKDRFVNAVVSDRIVSQPIEFYINPDDPHMSSINLNWAKGHLKSKGDLKRALVEQVTLAQIIQSNLVFLGLQTSELRNESIFILSVDVEGHDLSVLQSNDWNAFTPDIICVETFELKSISELKKNAIFNFLELKNYELCSFSPLTSIFKLKSGPNFDSQAV